MVTETKERWWTEGDRDKREMVTETKDIWWTDGDKDKKGVWEGGDKENCQ